MLCDGLTCRKMYRYKNPILLHITHTFTLITHKHWSTIKQQKKSKKEEKRKYQKHTQSHEENQTRIEYSLRPHYLAHASGMWFFSLIIVAVLHVSSSILSSHSRFAWFPISLWLVFILWCGFGWVIVCAIVYETKWGNSEYPPFHRRIRNCLKSSNCLKSFPSSPQNFDMGIWVGNLRWMFLSEVCILSEKSMVKLKKTIFEARIIGLRFAQSSQKEP